MSPAWLDLGYGPAPTSARELLRAHREAVDPPPPPATPIVARCHECAQSVDVRRGVLVLHDRPASLAGRTVRVPCKGSAEVARG